MAEQQDRFSAKNKSPNKVAVLVLAIPAMLSLICCWLIVEKYPPDTRFDQLSAVGQMLGALFSFWAILGIIASQIIQQYSLNLQREALVAQAISLEDQIKSSALSTKALAMELLASSVQQIEAACDRYARSLVLSLPDTDTTAVLAEIANSDLEGYSAAFCRYIIENERVLNDVLGSIEMGLTASIAKSFVSILDRARTQSKALSDDVGAINPFDIYFQNSSTMQLRSHLEKALRVKL